jgi:DnaJ-class molecular chaperone
MSETKRPVILIHESFFGADRSHPYTISSFIRELQSVASLFIIIVGEGFGKSEVESAFHRDSKCLYRISHVKESSFDLRPEFVEYFSKASNINFSRYMTVTTKRTAGTKNNIVLPIKATDAQVTKFIKRILKFYNILFKTKDCSECLGTGKQIEYDACGCEDTKYTCNSCGGQGKVAYYELA